MAKYRFHVSTDDPADGIDAYLPNLTAVRREAVLLLGHLLLEDPEAFWPDGVTVWVEDSRSRRVLTIGARSGRAVLPGDGDAEPPADPN